MPRLSQQQRILVHQVHPGKLAADISASVVSNMLLWQDKLVPGLVVRYTWPVVGSALVLRFGDVDQVARTARGRYVLQHMPPAMVALRLLGDTVMEIGAWRRRPEYVVLGALLVLVGWSHGLIDRTRG